MRRAMVALLLFTRLSPAQTLVPPSDLSRLQHLFEPHPVEMASRTDMEVPRDNRQCAEANVPVVGRARPAPNGEAWNPSQHGVILAQRKVIDENRAGMRWQRAEPGLRNLASRRAPGGA